MTVLITRHTVDLVSRPFKVAAKQLTVYATSLAPGEYVQFEMVQLSGQPKDMCECPPPNVQLPAVIWSAPLLCCGEPILLTPERPAVIIDFPQQVLVRAQLITNDPEDTDALVRLQETQTPNVNDRMRGCPC